MRYGIASGVLLVLAALLAPSLQEGGGVAVVEPAVAQVQVQTGTTTEPVAECQRPEQCDTTWCDCAMGPAAYRGCSFGSCAGPTCDALCSELGGTTTPR